MGGFCGAGDWRGYVGVEGLEEGEVMREEGFVEEGGHARGGEGRAVVCECFSAHCGGEADGFS